MKLEEKNSLLSHHLLLLTEMKKILMSEVKDKKNFRAERGLGKGLKVK